MDPMLLPGCRGPTMTLAVCLLLHVVSFTQQLLVIAFFFSKNLFFSGVPVATAFFLSGLICARAAWVCKPGVGGLLPLRDQPRLAAWALALMFGWCQLVVAVLAVQDYYQKAADPDAPEADLLPSLLPQLSPRGGAAASTRSEAVRGAERRDPAGGNMLLEVSASPSADLEQAGRQSSRPCSQEALRPWKAHGGPSRFHCKAVDGAIEAFVFGAALETTYWTLDWPLRDPIWRETAAWESRFLQIMIVLAFVAAACSVLELDHAVSDAARKQMRERWWYAPWHWLLRVAEICTRVSLHSIFLVLMRKHSFCWAPLAGTFLFTFICICRMAGVDRIQRLPGVRFLLMLLVSTLCVMSDLFLFVDHPHERHASQCISACLFARNVVEIAALPLAVWLQVAFGDPAVLSEQDLWDFVGTGLRDDGHLSRPLHAQAFMMLVGSVVLYVLLRLALPRMLPQPFWDLYDACRAGRYEEVQRALGATTGPDINCADAEGYTPLMLAALHGHAMICLLLLCHGAHADARRKARNTLLARCFGSWCSPWQLSWTSMHICAWRGSPEHAQILQYHLRAAPGASDVKDAVGNTPLHVAVLYGNQTLLQQVAGEFPAWWFTEKNLAGKLAEDLAQTEAIRVQVQGEATAANARSNPLLAASNSSARGVSLAVLGPRSAPPSGLPVPPNEPEGWDLESVRVRTLDRETKAGLCSFVLTQGTCLLNGLLSGPLPALPEEQPALSGSGQGRLRRSNSDPGFSPSGTLDTSAASLEIVADRLRLEDLEPCGRFSGLPLLESSEDASTGLDAWSKPPVEAFVGGGTFGKVYRARRRYAAAAKDEASFAVKRIVKRSRAADRESEVSERVRQRPHPCVVRIHDVVDLPAVALVLVAMEYCPGPDPAVGHDLCSAVKYFAASTPEGVMPEAMARRVFAEVFLGLEHLHVRMRSLLRDLKHHNVGLDAAGHAKLLDFGLGRLDLYAPNAAWSFGSPPGSPGWAAPEIFVNRPYTVHCDLYSLGVLLWVLCTGGVHFSSHPPSGNYGTAFRRYYNDHFLLQGCIDRPRSHHAKPMASGPALDLVRRLVSEKPVRRGDHAGLRAHPFLAAAALPDVRATAREVAAWVASAPGLRAAAAASGA